MSLILHKKIHKNQGVEYYTTLICNKIVKIPKNGIKNKIENEVFENNLSRARSKFFDYGFNNDFKYFVTITQNSNRNKFDLKEFIDDVNKTFKKIKRRNKKFFYIYIVEQHKSRGLSYTLSYK